LVFSGNASYDLGQGQASQNPYDWIVGGLSYPEVYGPAKTGGLIKTGYSYLLSKATQAGLNIGSAKDICQGSVHQECRLQNVKHGIYSSVDTGTTNKGMRIVGDSVIPDNINVVILVDGDLTLTGRITVPVGSTVVFAVQGNIIIDKALGEATVSSTTGTIQGIYSTDSSFIIQGNNSCSTGADLRFNVAGAVITNAGLTGGTLQNQRDLCSGNISCPAFSTIERLDLILNTPDFMKQANFTYQEIAP
jgi:hypothetical protein